MGVKEGERQDILKSLEESVRGVYESVVKGQEERKSDIQSCTESAKEEISRLASSLLIPEETPDIGSKSLLEHQEDVTARRRVMQGIFDERQSTLEKLKSELHGLWEELECKFDAELESIGDRLTTTRMQQFRSGIDAAKQERARRIEEVEQLRDAASALWEDLDWQAGSHAVPSRISADVAQAPPSDEVESEGEGEPEQEHGETDETAETDEAAEGASEEAEGAGACEDHGEDGDSGSADEKSEEFSPSEAAEQAPEPCSGAGAEASASSDAAETEGDDCAAEELSKETAGPDEAGEAAAPAASPPTESEIQEVAAAAAVGTAEVGVRPGRISALRALVDGLEEEKAKREGIIKSLGENITALWGKLRTPAGDQHAFLESHEGVGDSTLKAVQEYLAGLEADFSEKIVDLTGKCRERIGELFVKMRVEGEDREALPEAAVPLLKGQITEEIYEKHIAFEKTIEAQHAVLAPTIALWDKRQVLLQEREEYLQIISDPKRLLSRGGGAARLREEKLEKRQKKLLPIVCKQLRKAAEEAEKQNGFEVRLGGVRVIDALDEFESSVAQGAAKKRQQKEEAKAKKRETISGGETVGAAAGGGGGGSATAGAGTKRGRASVRPRASKVSGGAGARAAGRARSRSTSSARLRAGSAAGGMPAKHGPVKTALRATQLGNKAPAAAAASKSSIPPPAVPARAGESSTGGPAAIKAKAKAGAGTGAKAGGADKTPSGRVADVHVGEEAKKSAAKIVSSLEV